MLINLSNHPSANWSEKQINVGITQYGQIIDLAFPQIDPESSDEEIEILVAKYLHKTVSLHPKAVHIMGELVFTFKLVNRLKSVGIVCVASTTYRNTIEKNGTKTSVFEFVQFRDY
jgi:hypothetical protein